MVTNKTKIWMIVATFLSAILAANVSVAEVGVESTSFKGEFRILSENEMTLVRGGGSCSNTGSSGPNRESPTSEDPVTLNSGNLTMDFTDLSIPAMGQDLAIFRCYNSQVASRVDGHQVLGQLLVQLQVQ